MPIKSWFIYAVGLSLLFHSIVGLPVVASVLLGTFLVPALELGYYLLRRSK